MTDYTKLLKQLDSRVSYGIEQKAAAAIRAMETEMKALYVIAGASTSLIAKLQKQIEELK